MCMRLAAGLLILPVASGFLTPSSLALRSGNQKIAGSLSARLRGGSSLSTSAQMTVQMSAPKIDGDVLFVKAGPDGQSLGDCPFAQKANIALRLKKVPFTPVPVSMLDKPDWFLALNEKGTVPVWRGQDGKVIAESDGIVDLADAVEGAPKLTGVAGSEEVDKLVQPVFSRFVGIMKNKDEAAEAELVAQLDKALADLESHVQSKGTKFLLGDAPTALDCKLGPFLFHMTVALPHYKKIQPLSKYPAVSGYWERLQELEEFKATRCADEAVIFGWSKFFK